MHHASSGRSGHRPGQSEHSAGHQKRQDFRHEDALGQWWVEPAELHRVAEAPARAHGRLVRDKIYPGMWRVVGTSGTLTDIVTETAKDVA
jgi:hypothetical protein